MPVTVFDIFTNADGAITDWNYTFEVLGSFSAVIVKTKLPSQEEFLPRIEDLDYVHTPGSMLIEFQTGYIPVAGEIVRIERYTNRERQIDYISGSTLSEANLDNDANRLTSVDQELEAGISNALRKNDAGTRWNGEGLPSENCAPAETGAGWVTLNQLEERLVNVELIDLTEPFVFEFTGDGSTTEFSLTGVSGIFRAQADVYVESVYQSSYASNNVYDIIDAEDSSYPTWGGGEDVLVFDEAPGDGETIEVKVFTGQALGVLPDNFVLGVNIVDDEVGLEHINVGAGVADRVMTFDADGDPAAEVIGLQHLTSAGQTIHGNVRAALNDATAGLMLSAFLRAPSAAVPMGGQQLRDMGAPTAVGDAVTKAYADALVAHDFAAVNVQDGSMPVNPDETHKIELGMQPHVFVLCGEYTAVGRVAWYVVTFRTGQLDRPIVAGGGSSNDGLIPAPTLRLTADATGVVVEMQIKGALSAWNNVSAFAIRV